MTHEDERRVLHSFPYKEGEIKILIAKKDCELGNHYHKIKTEKFRLIEGSANMRNGNIKINNMLTSSIHTVLPHDMHSFEIKKDSILFCVCSHPYNENDDYT